MERPNLDEQSYLYLHSIQKWSMFIAIVGFVFMILMLAFFLLMNMFFANFFQSPEFAEMQHQMQGRPKFGTGLTSVFTIIMLAIYFFPIYFLFKFSRNLKKSLKTGNDYELSTALNFLNKHYKFIGWLMIIGIVLYGIMLIAMGAGFMLGKAFG